MSDTSRNILDMSQAVTLSDHCVAHLHDAVRRESAARVLVPVALLAEAVEWASEVTALAEHLEVDLPLLQTRLDSLTACERDYLREVAARRTV